MFGFPIVQPFHEPDFWTLKNADFEDSKEDTLGEYAFLYLRADSNIVPSMGTDVFTKKEDTLKSVPSCTSGRTRTVVFGSGGRRSIH